MNEEEKKAIDELSKKAVICNYEEKDYPSMICFKKDMLIALNLIEKLQKENEELKEENEYNKILLDMNNNFTIDKKTGNYKWNVIEIQKVKDKIRHYQELQDNYIKKYDEINEGLQAMINALQELIEEREVKEYDKEDIIPKNKKGSI